MRKIRDDARQISFLSDAPADERIDAQTQLSKSHMPLSSDLIPNEDIQRTVDYISSLREQQMLVKGGGSIPIPSRKTGKKSRGQQSVYLDDLQIFAHGEYYDKPSPLGFESLRSMVDQTPVLNAVIMTRIRQVSRFTKPQEDDGGTGFVIRHRDKDHKATPDEEAAIQEITRFFNNCGWEFDPRKRQRLKRDNFTQFMSKSVRDSLTMDSAPIETEMKRDARKGMDGFYAVDGATIRLCSEEGYRGDDEIFGLQVIQGQMRTAYTYNDLIYVPRNPRTDVKLTGYGLGETELMVRVVTGFLNAMTYNIKGFDENAIPKGMLHLSGNYDKTDLDSFKRYWNAMVKGVNNSWTVPVMVSKDQESRAAFENFGKEFDEMHFSKWMTFLVSVICAIYSMSPDEINFESFSSNTSSMSGDDTAEKLASSKDKGLRPLLSYYESIMSDYICSVFSDKYVFRFAGLEPEDKDKKHELNKLTKTINELRLAEGGAEADGEWGNAPANPALHQIWLQEQQANQPEDFGSPDDAETPDEQQPESAAEDDNQEESAPDEKEQAGSSQQPDDFDGNPREGEFRKSFPTIYTIET